MSASTSSPLLKVENLKVYFPILGGVFRHKVGEVKAVDDVSFEIQRGQTVGLVGESGSGKTMTALAIIGLLPQPGGLISRGSIRLRGEEVVGCSATRLQQIRGGEIGMIFQEPMTALNPRLRQR